MTREEAIDRIQAMLYYMESPITNEGEQKDIEAYRMAIKALKQEPKIVPIAEIKFDDDKLHEIVEEAVKNIEIEPKWIPVSERLPEISTWVLATYKDRDGDICLDIMIINEWTGSWESRFDDDDFADGFIANVIAWMPLPEPYKPQESEDKE